MMKSIVNLATALVLLFLVVVGAAIIYYQGREVKAAHVENDPVVQVEAPKADELPRAKAPEAPKTLAAEDPVTVMSRVLRASEEFRAGYTKVVRELSGDQPAGPAPEGNSNPDSKAPKQPKAAAIGKKPEAEDVEVKTAPEVVHVVSEGDTLYGISRQHYGTGSRWTEIAKANGIADGHILKGQKLHIPGAKPPVETAEKK